MWFIFVPFKKSAHILLKVPLLDLRRGDRKSLLMKVHTTNLHLSLQCLTYLCCRAVQYDIDNADVHLNDVNAHTSIHKWQDNVAEQRGTRSCRQCTGRHFVNKQKYTYVKHSDISSQSQYKTGRTLLYEFRMKPFTNLNSMRHIRHSYLMT